MARARVWSRRRWRPSPPGPRHCSGPRSTGPAARARRCCRASPPRRALHVFVSDAAGHGDHWQRRLRADLRRAVGAGVERPRPRRHLAVPAASSTRRWRSSGPSSASSRAPARSSWSRMAAAQHRPATRRRRPARRAQRHRGVRRGPASARRHPGRLRLRRRGARRCAAARPRASVDGGARQLLRRPRRAVRPPDRDLLEHLREHRLLYDRAGRRRAAARVHRRAGPGFHVELLERRHGYEGYGSANTFVRLASQLP